MMTNPRSSWFSLFIAGAVALSSTIYTQPLCAQNSQKKQEELKPRLEKIVTKDGNELAVGYFPSDKEKKAVPVILIHEWKGAAPPYLPLATALRDAGCAVVTPDLRGHGGSKNYVDPRGNIKEFDLARMNKGDVAAILNRDIEAVKKFLKEENDKGKLNLNALVVIGVGEGGILAANYAVIDWSFPDLGDKKQSKDVRALVVVSPERNLLGVNFDSAARDGNISRLPWMIVVGENSPQMNEADKLHKQLERVRRTGAMAGPALLVPIRSNASNAQLIRSGNVIPQIVEFVKTNVIDRQEQYYPWVDRSVE